MKTIPDKTTQWRMREIARLKIENHELRTSKRWLTLAIMGTVAGALVVKILGG